VSRYGARSGCLNQLLPAEIGKSTKLYEVTILCNLSGMKLNEDKLTMHLQQSVRIALLMTGTSTRSNDCLKLRHRGLSNEKHALKTFSAPFKGKLCVLLTFLRQLPYNY
jgi:hypothetical protein